MALTDKTPTTIGFLLTMAAGIVSGVLWLNGKFAETTASASNEIKAVSDQVDTVRGELRDLTYKVERIDDKVTNYVTRDEFRAWVLQFALDNAKTMPDLKVQKPQ